VVTAAPEDTYETRTNRHDTRTNCQVYPGRGGAPAAAPATTGVGYRAQRRRGPGSAPHGIGTPAVRPDKARTASIMPHGPATQTHHG
jgi:hypothetical protein